MFDCDLRGAVCGSYMDDTSLSTIEDGIARSHNPVARLSWKHQNPNFQKKIENVIWIYLNSGRPWHFRLKFRSHPLVHIQVHSKRSKKSPHDLPVHQKVGEIGAGCALVFAGCARFFAGRAGFSLVAPVARRNGDREKE